MNSFTVKHELDCSADRARELMLSTDFCQKLFAFLDVPKWDAQVTETDDEVVRRVDAMPKVQMPAIFQKLFGASLAYKEDMHFDKKTKVMTMKYKAAFSSRLRNEVEMRAEPRGDNKCEWVITLTHEAPWFAVGGLMEKSMAKQTTDNWVRAADFVNRWVRQHPTA